MKKFWGGGGGVKGELWLVNELEGVNIEMIKWYMVMMGGS